MNNLKELYDSGVDIKDSDIPDKWKESFNNFIFGQTCMIDIDGDGNRQFLYYSWDFKTWYHLNQKEIERDINIDTVIN
jgi:hypothetical protein